MGEGVKTVDEVNQLALDLFSGADGREAVRIIDQEVSRLPGLGGLHVMERILDRACEMTGAAELVSAAQSPAAIELRVPVRA